MNNSKPVGPMTLFIGTHNCKIRIWKLDKNYSLWTKFDPLITNIF